MTLPLCAALLFLVGVGPVLPWRGIDTDSLMKRLVVPGIALVVAGGVAVLLGTHNVFAILAFGLVRLRSLATSASSWPVCGHADAHMAKE
jgi:cytochrome c biogenesis factor